MRTKIPFTSFLFLLYLVACTPFSDPQNSWEVFSPDRSIKVLMELDSSNTLFYSVDLEGSRIIQPSVLGISLMNEKLDFHDHLSFVSVKDTMISETYTLPTGKKSSYSNHAAEKKITFRNESGSLLNVVFRVYNDGLGFKYMLSNSHPDTIKIETSYFNLPPSSNVWIQKYTPDYENFYTRRRLDTMNMDAYALPALIETPDQKWVLISDAAVFGNYAAAQLTREDELLKVHLPDQDHWRENPIPGTWEEIAANERKEILVEPNAETPWRAIIIGKDLNAIVESTMIENLNPPSELGDISWIKPGIAVFPWWGNSEANDNPEILKAYIDLASEMNWDYLEFDIGLLGNKGGYAINYWRDVDYIPEIISYASEKGIGVYGWDERKFLDTPEKRDDIFSKYADWGIKGIKMDFLNSDKQEAMQFREEATRHAAAYKLLVSYHGEITPRGARRTFPNLMTQEGVRGAEYYKFAPDDGIPTPVHNCTLPFTRNVVGPMDYTPTSFSTPRRTTSYVHELALPLIYESGWVCMADKPEEFLNSPAKDLLQNLHASWDDIHFIAGYPGEYCCLARRKGDDWYVAAINAGDKRQIEIDFTFLDDSAYEAKLYTDENGSVKIKNFEIHSITSQSFIIEKDGGLVIWLRKNN
ncbi:MAG: glycoside hydrolase family 97 catalytic domain-containing protein [Cyclobacteriaceae bacterium]|nr:glycoside hydrolase family 97 catalytic domain-containing protein [Cyclobacteriaceae bacterium]